MEKVIYVNEVENGGQLQELRMRLFRKRGTKIVGQMKDYMSRPDFEKVIKKAAKKSPIAPSPNTGNILDIENNNKPVPATWLALLPKAVEAWFDEHGRPTNVFLSKEEERQVRFEEEQRKTTTSEVEDKLKKPKETKEEKPKVIKEVAVEEVKKVEKPKEEKQPSDEERRAAELAKQEQKQARNRRAKLIIGYNLDALNSVGLEPPKGKISIIKRSMEVSETHLLVAMVMRLNNVDEKDLDTIINDLCVKLGIKDEELLEMLTEMVS